MLRIINARNATNYEWDTIWNSCTTSTYYHSREWAEIWHSYTNGTIRPVPRLISFSDRKKVLLPIIRQNYYGGIIKRYGLVGPPSVANAKYGNWLTSDTLTDKHIKLLANYLLKKYNNLVWRLNPYDEYSKKVSVNSKYTRRIPFVTYIINLTKGEEYIYSNMKPSCRSKIKQGIKNKLIVTEGTDINHWKNYYEIYRDTINRWGSKTLYALDWKLFEILFYKNSPNIKLWLVWYHDIAIAGGINFHSHEKIMGWHIASLTAYHKLRPVNLLNYIIIKDGIKNNYCWYDFGTAGGNKGLQKFKQSFGPEEKMCDMLISWHPIIYHMKNVMDRY
jgi:hypothetical protein